MQTQGAACRIGLYFTAHPGRESYDVPHANLHGVTFHNHIQPAAQNPEDMPFRGCLAGQDIFARRKIVLAGFKARDKKFLHHCVTTQRPVAGIPPALEANRIQRLEAEHAIATSELALVEHAVCALNQFSG